MKKRQSLTGTRSRVRQTPKRTPKPLTRVSAAALQGPATFKTRTTTVAPRAKRVDTQARATAEIEAVFGAEADKRDAAAAPITPWLPTVYVVVGHRGNSVGVCGIHRTRQGAVQHVKALDLKAAKHDRGYTFMIREMEIPD